MVPQRIPNTVVLAVVLLAARTALNLWVVFTEFAQPFIVAAVIGMSIPLGLGVLVLLGDWRARHALGVLVAIAAARTLFAMLTSTGAITHDPTALASPAPLIDFGWALGVLALLYVPASHPWFARQPPPSPPTA